MALHSAIANTVPASSMRLRWALIGGLALLQLMICASVLLVMMRVHETTKAQAIATVERGARTAEAAINRTLLQADSALASIPVLLVDTGESRAEPLTAEQVSRRLRAFSFQMFAFRDIILLKPDGTVWAAGRSGGRHATGQQLITAADHNEAVGSGIVIGPIKSSSGGDWKIYVARRIHVPGVGPLLAAAEVPVASLLGPIGQAGDEVGLKISVHRRDGSVLGISPHDELQIGRPLALWPQGEAPEAAPGLFADASGKAVALGLMRTTFYRDIQISVALDLDVAYNTWTTARGRLLIGLSLITLLLATFGIVVFKGLHRLEGIDRARLTAQHQLESAIEAMADGFVMWDSEDRFVTCNTKYRELYKQSAPFLVPGAPFAHIMREGALNGQYPQMTGDVDSFVAGLIAWRQAATGSFERLLPDGTWLLVTERRTENGAYVGIRTDITALKRAQQDLADAHAQLQTTLQQLSSQNTLFDAALRNMSHGLLMVTAERRVIVSNVRFCELFGLGEAEAEHGRDFAALMTSAHRACPDEAAMVDNITASQLALAQGTRSGIFVAIGRGGRAIEVTQRPMEDGGFVATYEDVTERQSAEMRIRHLAHHDALTNLPNRVSFRSGLEEAIARKHRGEGDLALVYFDLDRFKDVNDTLGHPAGDRLLIEVARRVSAELRPDETVYRLGGDEFAVMVTGAHAPARAQELGQRLIGLLSAPSTIEGQSVSIGVSVGIATADRGALEPDDLLKQADVALYAAKGSGRGHCCEFAPEMAARLERRIRLEGAMRGALAENQFELAYQPIFDIATGQPVSFEALLRWRHPVLGQISPGEFIPIAEENGLIEEIGAWCMARACHDIAPLPEHIRIAVNLSPVQLRAGTLVGTVEDALAHSGLAPARLELEVTETAILTPDERVVGQLADLQRRGIRVALDDFGVGFSSLNHLRRFPFDKIKIDQVFVREALERSDCRAIIKAIVQLAESLQLRTTAEGIETQEQLDLIRGLGCSEAQGYFLGRPAPLLTAAATLARPPVAEQRPRLVSQRS